MSNLRRGLGGYTNPCHPPRLSFPIITCFRTRVKPGPTAHVYIHRETGITSPAASTKKAHRLLDTLGTSGVGV